MGNQAFIVPKHSNVGIYVHWNGGRGSVEGFLTYAELSGLRPLGASAGTGDGLDALTGVPTRWPR